MVRDPFEADPPSLLRGDDYFLSEVNKALGTIAATGRKPPRRAVGTCLTRRIMTCT